MNKISRAGYHLPAGLRRQRFADAPPAGRPVARRRGAGMSIIHRQRPQQQPQPGGGRRRVTAVDKLSVLRPGLFAQSKKK